MSGWHNSDRRDHLPSNWEKIREQRFRMDGFQCTALDANTGERCPAPAEECDHIGDRDDHRLKMLRSLCTYHHGKKSGGQGAAARAKAIAQNRNRFRRTETHPGLR